MRSLIITILCGLLIIAGIASNAGAADKAPDFKLKDLKGKTVHLADVYKKGPVLITFWSTWCKNCPEEMKHFQRYYDKYKDQGLTVLAVAIDDSKTVAKVKPWVVGRRFTYPVLYDTNHDVKLRYHVRPVPHSFIVDTQGKIVYSHIGYRPGEEVAYEKKIKELLAAKPAKESDCEGEAEEGHKETTESNEEPPGSGGTH